MSIENTVKFKNIYLSSIYLSIYQHVPNPLISGLPLLREVSLI